MKPSFSNPVWITAAVVLTIGVVIAGTALFLHNTETPVVAASGSGMQHGSTANGDSDDCTMMKGCDMPGMKDDGDKGCTMLKGKVLGIDKDGSRRLIVKAAENNSDAAKEELRELKVGEAVSLMIMTGKAGASEKAAMYACPMHPKATSGKPGTCPKCGMNLEPIKSGATHT